MSACAPSRRLQSLLAVQDQTPRSPPTSSPMNAVDSAWAELMGTTTSSDDDAPAIGPNSKTIRRAASSLHPGSQVEPRDSFTGSAGRIGPAVRTVVLPIQRSGSSLRCASKSMSLEVHSEESSNIVPAVLPLYSRHTASASSALASSITSPPSGSGGVASGLILSGATPMAGTSSEAGGGGNMSMQCCPVKLITASEIVPSAKAAAPGDSDDLSQQPQSSSQLKQQASAAVPALGGLAWHEVEALPIIDPITKQTVSQGILAHTGISSYVLM